MSFSILRILGAYGLLYSTRNLLSASSTYLFDEGVLTPKTYAIMQTASYALVFSGRLTAGYLSRITGRTTLAMMYNLLSVLTFAAYIGLSGAALREPSPKTLTALFITCYCLVKLLCALAKVLAIGIFSRMNMNREQLSRAVTALQVLSCVGDSLGKLGLGTMLKSTTHWAWPIFYLSAADGASAIFSFPACLNLQSRPPLASGDAGPARKPLYRHRRFGLCLLVSICNSIVGGVIGSYMTHYMRYSLDFDAAEVARLDAITPLLIIFTTGIFGYMTSRVAERQNRVMYVMLLPTIISILIFAGLGYATHEKKNLAALILVFAHQGIFCALQNITDGAYLMLVVRPDTAAFAAGTISAFGYLVALFVPFAVVDYTTSKSGWMVLLVVVFILKVLSVLPILFLLQVDRRRTCPK